MLLQRLSALPAEKFAPVTVTVNAAPLGAALAGLMLEICGAFGEVG